MIYILMLSRPLGSSHPLGQAGFYLGYCEDGRLVERMAEHRAGRGAAMLRACNEQGITYRPILTFNGDRIEERRLHNLKNTPKLVRRYRPDLFREES